MNSTKRIAALERENGSLRDALFGILRQLGRVRVDKATVDGLRAGDGMKVTVLPDGAGWIFEFTESNMVVPGGVQNGVPSGRPEGAA